MIRFKQFLTEDMRPNTFELLKSFGVSEDELTKYQDLHVEWHNDNKRKAVDKLIKKPTSVHIKNILLFKANANQSNYAKPLATVREIQQFANSKITIWRGGAGKYDKDWCKDCKWVSFTRERNLVNKFSKLDGSIARPGFHILEKNKQYWIVELSIPVKDILLYFPWGYDEEVIVPYEWAKKAKVIEQT